MIFFRVSNLLFQQVEGLQRYSLWRNACHAAVVNRAFTELAGGAMDWLADDAGVWADGPGADMIGASEDGDTGSSDCVGNVHGTAVVGEHELAIGYQLDEFAEFGAPCIIVDGNAAGFETGFDDCDNVGFCRAAKEGDARVAGQRYLGGGFSESFGIPAFCSAEGSTGANADYGLRVTLDAVKANEGFCIVAVDPASKVEEFKVIETFVAHHRHRDRMGEQEPAAVAIVASAFGDAREKCEGGRFKGILQKESLVEAAPETPGQSELGGPALVWIGNYFIAKRF
jgi:hypothetical protein